MESSLYLPKHPAANWPLGIRLLQNRGAHRSLNRPRHRYTGPVRPLNASGRPVRAELVSLHGYLSGSKSRRNGCELVVKGNFHSGTPKVSYSAAASLFDSNDEVDAEREWPVIAVVMRVLAVRVHIQRMRMILEVLAVHGLKCVSRHEPRDVCITRSSCVAMVTILRQHVAADMDIHKVRVPDSHHVHAGIEIREVLIVEL